MSLAKALPFVLVASVAAASSPGRVRIDITGDYTSNWDAVHLVQEGTRIRGTYVCCGGGTIEGRIIENRVIRFAWHEPRGAGDGHGVWTLTPSGSLDGTWGHGGSTSDGGPWTLVLKAQSGQIAQ
jgi:hypothetical protein